MSIFNRKSKATNEAIAAIAKSGAQSVATAIVQAEQQKTREGAPLTGAEKLEYAVGILNDLVDIPLVPEAIEKVVFKFALSILIESLNKAFGKTEWFKKLTDVATSRVSDPPTRA